MIWCMPLFNDAHHYVEASGNKSPQTESGKLSKNQKKKLRQKMKNSKSTAAAASSVDTEADSKTKIEDTSSSQLASAENTDNQVK